MEGSISRTTDAQRVSNLHCLAENSYRNYSETKREKRSSMVLLCLANKIYLNSDVSVIAYYDCCFFNHSSDLYENENFPGVWCSVGYDLICNVNGPMGRT